MGYVVLLLPDAGAAVTLFITETKFMWGLTDSYQNEARFIRRISVASNAIQTIDN